MKSGNQQNKILTVRASVMLFSAVIVLWASELESYGFSSSHVQM